MHQWPHIEQDEIQAVNEVLQSGRINYWTSPEVKHFEHEFADFVNCHYGIALANGTVALELALWALGIGPGHEVITTPRTFMATASSIARQGATPVFADIDPESQNLSPASIEQAITARTRAIIPVHLAGWPCEMDTINALAERYGLYVIEDCAQAHGATYRGNKVGSWGHMAAFSFCQDKIMTTGGEGGMLVTNDAQLYQRAWSLKDHGKDYQWVFNQPSPGHGYRWVHGHIGTNWRMTPMQAAVGRCQLAKLEGWLARRRANARKLNDALRDYDLFAVPEPADHIAHAYYKYSVLVQGGDGNPAAWRDQLLAQLNEAGVPARVGVCPELYREQSLNQYTPARGYLPQARDIGQRSLVLPNHHRLTDEDLDTMISAMHTAVKSGVTA